MSQNPATSSAPQKYQPESLCVTKSLGAEGTAPWASDLQEFHEGRSRWGSREHHTSQLLDVQEAHGTVTQTPPKVPQPMCTTKVNSNTLTGGPQAWAEQGAPRVPGIPSLLGHRPDLHDGPPARECPPHLASPVWCEPALPMARKRPESSPDSSPSGAHLPAGTRAQLHMGEPGRSPDRPVKTDLPDGTEGQLRRPRWRQSGSKPTFREDCTSLPRPGQC